MKNHTCNSPIGDTTANLSQVSISFDGATHRHADGPTVFDCSDIPADHATILLVQAFEPLPHWFSARSRYEEPGWENFQRVIHAQVVPYMVQNVKRKAVLQKRQGCRPCGVTLRTAKRFVLLTATTHHVGPFFRWDSMLRLMWTWMLLGRDDRGNSTKHVLKCKQSLKELAVRGNKVNQHW